MVESCTKVHDVDEPDKQKRICTLDKIQYRGDIVGIIVNLPSPNEPEYLRYAGVVKITTKLTNSQIDWHVFGCVVTSSQSPRSAPVAWSFDEGATVLRLMAATVLGLKVLQRELELGQLRWIREIHSSSALSLS